MTRAAASILMETTVPQRAPSPATVGLPRRTLGARAVGRKQQPIPQTVDEALALNPGLRYLVVCRPKYVAAWGVYDTYAPEGRQLRDRFGSRGDAIVRAATWNRRDPWRGTYGPALPDPSPDEERREEWLQ